MTPRRFLLLLLALVLLAPMSTTGQAPPVKAVLAAESEVRIEGRSTVNRFTCEASEARGEGIRTQATTTASLVVPVRALDCGNRQMNADLAQAMRAKQHPQIRFELIRAELLEAEQVRVTGRIELAGQEQIVTFDVAAQESYGIYRLKGSLPLKMSQFGITPPTALLGLVRAHDDLTVHFNLHVQLNGRL